MSWVALEDVISALLFIISSSLSGAVNVVAPHPVMNKEFTKTLGAALGRPAVLPLPGFALRLLFGEMADALLLSSTRCVPQKLIEAGFEFRFPVLSDALKNRL